ncbi:unnamed protein product [Caenorhabditis sp. 36 PRJEB53466]|nr:unnamed protein product [Caenorhabditis sp. 36 PRJEB53466]
MSLAFSTIGVEIGTVLAIICAGFSLNTGFQLGLMRQILRTFNLKRKENSKRENLSTFKEIFGITPILVFNIIFNCRKSYCNRTGS